MRYKLIIFAVLLLFSSCCEKIEPDIVDQVVGIYQGELIDQFFKIPNYKVKVIKLSPNSVKIVPYIGNEIKPQTVYLKLSNSGEKLVREIEGYDKLIFYIKSKPIKMYFKDTTFADEFSGSKIE